MHRMEVLGGVGGSGDGKGGQLVEDNQNETCAVETQRLVAGWVGKVPDWQRE